MARLLQEASCRDVPVGPLDTVCYSLLCRSQIKWSSQWKISALFVTVFQPTAIVPSARKTSSTWTRNTQSSNQNLSWFTKTGLKRNARTATVRSWINKLGSTVSERRKVSWRRKSREGGNQQWFPLSRLFYFAIIPLFRSEAAFLTAHHASLYIPSPGNVCEEKGGRSFSAMQLLK